MSKLNSKFSIFLTAYLMLAVYTAQTHAITLSQSPLFLSQGADPNVVFVIDDSGSMRFETMPERYRMAYKHVISRDISISITTDALFPRTASGLFSVDDDYHIVAPGGTGNVYGMLVRSSNNTIYYNPAIHYKPWIKWDGTSFPQANPTCAYDIPTKNTGAFAAACRNLAPAVNEAVAHPSTANDAAWRPIGSYSAGTSTFDIRDGTGSFANGDTIAINGRTYKVVSSERPSGQPDRWRLTITPALGNNITTSRYIIFSPQLLSCTASNNCTISREGNFYPATYWYYEPTATNVWSESNYTKVEIKPAIANYTGHGRTALTRPDCTTNIAGVTTCTYAKEIQNFANWYSYYRNRYLTSAAGTGFAFQGIDGGMRVAYGSINKGTATVDGISTKVLRTGVRDFTGSDKQAFFTNLYAQDVAGGTPLRSALTAVGEYYKNTTDAGPWSNTPGGSTSSTTDQAACRISNTILMTDGYWNDDISSFTEPGNSDNTSVSGKYTAAAPFMDAYSNSLADVAMEYWKNDLHPSLADKVATIESDGVTLNPATWQHMTTYTVGLGVQGTLNVNTNVADVIQNGLKDKDTGAVLSWPNYGAQSAEAEEKIDDLFHAAVNGRGRYFSAKNPTEFAEGLRDTLRNIADNAGGSAAAAAANSTSLNTGSAIYTAVFNSHDWSGNLQSKAVNASGTLASSLNWTSTIPNAASRTILSYSTATNSGIIFDWDNLSNDQKNNLAPGSGVAPPAVPDSTAVLAGQARANWIKGQAPADDVAAATYDLRSRTNLMGDVVNSDPAYAGNNDMGFSRLSAALGGGTTYKEYFDTQKKNRREVIYVGANDGMLHGFNAKNPVSGTTKTLGQEVFAYVPSQVYPNLPKLTARDYGKPTNRHRYFVDGPATISDAYVKGSWKNILVGTLGAGGKGIFVLDVTNPDAMTAGKVLFELTPAKYPELGNITGKAIVAPAADGRWKIFLGNGYNSNQGGSDKAYLGVIDIDDEVDSIAASSSRTRFIGTNITAGNVLAQPALLASGQGYVTAAYAGDLLGNMWKFDLSSTDKAEWGLAFSGSPLFKAKIDNIVQPITASPTLGFNSALDPARVMVYFGTGRYAADTDNTPITNKQSFYAIADKGMAVDNSAGDRSGLHAKAIGGTSTSSKRVITGEVTAGANAVPWATAKGWYLDFPANERVVTKPLLLFDRLIFPTIVPSNDICSAGGGGWLMELIAVGDKNVSYSVLGSVANSLLDVPIYGNLSSIEGPGDRNRGSAGSASSASSASNDCGAGANSGRSGAIAVLANDADGNARSFVGGRPCDLYGRQSWRELE